MRKHRRVLILLGLLGILVVAGGLVVLWPVELKPGVNPENFRRLKLGMTEADVEKILGKPSADGAWREDGSIYYVVYGNPDGTVNYAHANVLVHGRGRTSFTLENATLIDRVRRWIRL